MANVLLIEPNALLAHIYREALVLSGYSVQIAISAQSAVSFADEACPDLIILELQLVNHNGIEFLYEFRSYADWQRVPLIALTHVPPEEFSESWKSLQTQLGVGEYLYKPTTSLDKLLQSVDRLVR